MVEVNLEGFAGTLDFQSRIGVDAEFINTGWVLIDDESAVAKPTNDQISFNGQPYKRRYLIPVCGPDFRIVMVRTAGSIDLNATGYGVLVQDRFQFMEEANSATIAATLLRMETLLERIATAAEAVQAQVTPDCSLI